MRLASRYTLANEYVLHISQWLDPKMRKSIIYNMLRNLSDTLGITSIRIRRATRIRSLQSNVRAYPLFVTWKRACWLSKSD
jgi:hypothetical protein